jgi:hypothetical protein
VVNPTKGGYIMVGALKTIAVFALASFADVAAQTPTASFQEALELGRIGEPAPYALHMNTAGTGVAGYVYTPFVRVAMAARAAHLQQKDLTVSELPDWLTQPIVYIALRWYCEDLNCAVPAQPITVRLLQRRAAPLAATWVSSDLNRLRSFGAEKPSADTVVVAAFPVAALTEGTMVEACVQVNEKTCSGRGGVITHRDLFAWK